MTCQDHPRQQRTWSVSCTYPCSGSTCCGSTGVLVLLSSSATFISRGAVRL